MARIPCRGCKKLVDMGSKTCPYCKTEIKGSGGWAKWVAGLFVVTAIAGMMTGNIDTVAERAAATSSTTPKYSAIGSNVDR